MKSLFHIGAKTTLQFTVGEKDLAEFETGVVHEFYGTFALGRDAEWTCRQFVLVMKEEGEEGIGTFLNIRHQSPALLNETVSITAEIIRLEGNSIDCSFEVRVGERIIATGTQGQKILKLEKLERLVEGIRGNG
ncbi:MAG: thioesterase family protein [Bacteroidia bacterium]